MLASALEKQDITALSEGSTIAFSKLYLQYNKAIYRNIFKIVKSSHYAEDLLQEVFVTLWQKRKQLDPEKSLAGWLFVVSYNKALMFLRENIRSQLLYIASYDEFEQLASEDPLDEVQFEKQISIIREAVNQLTPRKRDVYRMCRFEGKTKEEVAALMGISTESVKDYLKQSNQAIRRYIEATYPYGTTGLLLLLGYLMLLS